MASWDYIDTFFTDPLDSTAPRSNYTDPPPVLPSLPPATSAPLQQPPIEPYHPSDGYVPQEPPRELPPPPPPQPIPVSHPQQQPPPSPRKSMFEFISPFDVLASNPTTIKKKPVPTATTSASSGNEDSWTSASLGSLNDPKRKSVENLIDQLTRGQAPYPSYEPYSTTDEYSQVEPNRSSPQQSQQQQQSRPMPPPPLPPKPGRVSPPRASPPKPPVQQQPQRPQGRSTESPVGQPIAPIRRDKDSSPGPRSTWKSDGRGKPLSKVKSQSSPRCAHYFIF